MLKTLTVINNNPLKSAAPTQVVKNRKACNRWVTKAMYDDLLTALEGFSYVGHEAVAPRQLYDVMAPWVNDSRFSVQTVSGMCNKLSKEGKIETWQKFKLNSKRNKKLYSVK